MTLTSRDMNCLSFDINCFSEINGGSSEQCDETIKGRLNEIETRGGFAGLFVPLRGLRLSPRRKIPSEKYIPRRLEDIGACSVRSPNSI